MIEIQHWRLKAILAAIMIFNTPAIYASKNINPIDLGTNVDWPFSGKSILNTHHADFESKINKNNVSNLSPKWIYSLDSVSGVSATPSVVNEVVYFPDWGGNLQAVNAETGATIWKKSFPLDYSSPGKQVLLARATPVYHNGTLYIGSNVNNVFAPNGAVMMAIDAKTGALKWSTLIDTTSTYSVITQAATVYNDIVYIGTSSVEEVTNCSATNSCTFRGSMVALDANTGAIKWQTYMTTPGYAGIAIWGGQPTLDLKRNSIYVGTGNNYTIDDDLVPIDSPDNHVDAIVALDMDTGSIKWSTKLIPNGQPDIWTFLCFVVPSPSCGPDYDFGQSPMLLTTKINGQNTDIIVNGQKSGLFFGLNPDNGQLIWTTPVGPGSALGGMEFGSATDGKYIYATITNFYNIPYHLINPAPGSLAATTGGLWTALDPATGNIVWQSADPDLNVIPAGVTVANGVLYGGSLSQDGTKSGAFTAMDRDTGKILWRYNTLIDTNNTGAVFGSPAIVKGKVYWGAGYPRIFPNGSSNQFFAFSINGK